MVNSIIERLQVTHLLDYGCGSARSLFKGLHAPHKLTYQAYDPGVPQFSASPVPAEMVACIDVLEHIEPDFIDNVMDDLKRVTQAVLFATVATGPAAKKLSDGRNAHLIQKPMEWWLPKFWERFDLQSVMADGVTSRRGGGGFIVVAYAKPQELMTS